MTGISKNQVSRLWRRVDDKIPGRGIVSGRMIIAIAVDADGGESPPSPSGSNSWQVTDAAWSLPSSQSRVHRALIGQ